MGTMCTEFGGRMNNLVGIAYAEEQDRDSKYIAPFVPSPQEVVDRMSGADAALEELKSSLSVAEMGKLRDAILRRAFAGEL